MLNESLDMEEYDVEGRDCCVGIRCYKKRLSCRNRMLAEGIIMLNEWIVA